MLVELHFKSKKQKDIADYLKQVKNLNWFLCHCLLIQLNLKVAQNQINWSRLYSGTAKLDCWM